MNKDDIKLVITTAIGLPLALLFFGILNYFFPGQPSTPFGNYHNTMDRARKAAIQVCGGKEYVKHVDGFGFSCKNRGLLEEGEPNE